MTKTATLIAVLCLLFALVSTAINIGSQMLSIWVYKGPLSVEVSILFIASMGVITTLIFWGTEYAFHLIYDRDFMRYPGSIIGLSISFYVKYQLDKKYMFVNSSTEAVS